LGYNEIYGNYGFLWYSRPNGKDAFVAVGYGGQYIYVSPLYNCVIVITSTLESKGRKWEKQLFDLIHSGIIGSIKIDQKKLLMAAGIESGAVATIENRTISEKTGTGRTMVRLNLRQGPNKSDSFITTLGAGTVLEIKEHKNSWLRVRAGSLNGWVFAKYVRIVSNKVAPVKKKKTAQREQEPVTASAAVKPGTGVLKKLQAEVEHISSRLHTSERTQKQVSVELNTIKKELNMQRDTATRSETGRESLVSELSELRSQNTALLDTLKAAQAGREEGDKELAELRKELASQRKAAEQFQSTQKAVEAELASARDEVAKISSAIDTAQSDREYAKSAIVPLHHKLKEQQKTINTSEEVQNQITQDLSMVHERIKLMEKTIADQQADRRMLTSEIASLGEQLNMQRDTAARSETDRESLASELSELRSQNSALLDTLKAAQAGREEGDKELAATNNQITSLKKELQDTLNAHRNKIEELNNRRLSSETRHNTSLNLEPIQEKLTAVTTGKTVQPPTPVKVSGTSSHLVNLSSDTDIVESFVRSWAGAWGRQDVKAYLSHYSKAFRPPGGIKLAAWYRQREKRLLKPAFIKIKIDNINQNMSGKASGRVSFIQTYQSDVFKDRVLKTLDLKRESGKWTISKETSKAIRKKFKANRKKSIKYNQRTEGYSKNIGSPQS
jgi:uncharacterized protein YraI